MRLKTGSLQGKIHKVKADSFKKIYKLLAKPINFFKDTITNINMRNERDYSTDSVDIKRIKNIGTTLFPQIR